MLRKVTSFEIFLQAFSDDPNLADKMIREAKPSNRLMMAFCLACLHGAYTITIEIRDSIENLPSFAEGSSSNPFPFDAVAQEVIAFIFFTVMAEHMEKNDDTEEEEPESEQFVALKEARCLAESITQNYTTSRTPEYIKGRLLSYSFAQYKKKSLFEEISNYIVAAIHGGNNQASAENIIQFAAIQHALSSEMLLAIKNGVNELYGDWQTKPEWFAPQS